MANRNDQLNEDLRAYNDSFTGHADKIRSNFGDRTMQFAIKGWINDCRHFATKSRDTALKILERGGRLAKVNSKSGETIKRHLDPADIDRMHADRILWLDEKQKNNDSRR